MTMSINSIATGAGGETYYDPKFCRLLEMYLPYFRGHENTTILSVDPHVAYKFEGDYYGLLDQHNIKREYHWVVMRINAIVNPCETPATLTQIMVPDFALIDRIKQLYKTKTKKIVT